jgi:hypothetical protein
VIDVAGAKSCGWSGGLDRVEAHGESERVGLANDAMHGAFGVEPGEVVAAEIGVLDVVGEHVRHRDQNRVFHGESGGEWAGRRHPAQPGRVVLLWVSGQAAVSVMTALLSRMVMCW